MIFNIQELQKASQGKLVQGNSSIRVKGISINSRSLKTGDAFIAIAGKNFDGHDFVFDAIKKKAAAVIIAKNLEGIPTHVPVIQVKDTIQALGQIARNYRDRFRIPVIAITGSAGKTTTKEMLAYTLAGRFKVLKNIGTENNHIGVPLTLLKLNSRYDMAVIELGTNRPGDIRWLTYIANPKVAIMTNIGESHLELLKSPLGVFREKFDLVRGMAKRGTVIFNGDDDYLNKIPSYQLSHKLIKFAIENKAEYQAGDIHMDHCSLHFAVNSKKGWKLRTLSRHNIYNALVAISCAKQFKMKESLIQKRLVQFRFPQGRQYVGKLGKGWLIDDTYNANPVSLRSALQTLSSLDIGGRKILVCGDMLELGTRSETLHRSVGRLVAVSNLNVLLTFGKMSEWIAKEAKKDNRALVVSHCRSVEQINKKLKNYCQTGDAILVKGSRGMRMERVVEFLKKNFN